MGWFWGSNDKASQADAYSKLDPALRDFLDKESPYKYRPAPPTSASPAARPSNTEPDTYRSRLGIVKNEPSKSIDAAQSAAATTTAPPPESLYQDGRYAHLWKNYKPLAEQEAAQQNDQDRLNDVIDAYNERKAQIGRAAVENCVFEQLAERDCFQRGGWHAKMTMCRDENKAFNRCYTMQARFLKALGYLSIDRTAEEDEKIQMHADKLYQEMLAREKAAQEAKEKGVPEPAYRPLLDASSAAQAMGLKPTTVSGPVGEQLQKQGGLDIYSVEKRQEIEKRLAGKTPAERDLEIQLMVAESKASVEYADRISQYYEDEKKTRADRRERGRETFGDSIKRLWGWDR
ncbi:hypothetical protein MBLNU459_g6500t3 [Dothideomycetes sp. NU459]